MAMPKNEFDPVIDPEVVFYRDQYHWPFEQIGQAFGRSGKWAERRYKLAKEERERMHER